MKNSARLIVLWNSVSIPFTKRVIRTQILFKGGDKYTFMLGYSGFGFWQSKRPFDRCAEGAVYGFWRKSIRSKRISRKRSLCSGGLHKRSAAWNLP
jgi:hypothetical protein